MKRIALVLVSALVFLTVTACNSADDISSTDATSSSVSSEELNSGIQYGEYNEGTVATDTLSGEFAEYFAKSDKNKIIAENPSGCRVLDFGDYEIYISGSRVYSEADLVLTDRGQKKQTLYTSEKGISQISICEDGRIFIFIEDVENYSNLSFYYDIATGEVIESDFEGFYLFGKSYDYSVEDTTGGFDLHVSYLTTVYRIDNGKKIKIIKNARDVSLSDGKLFWCDKNYTPHLYDPLTDSSKAIDLGVNIGKYGRPMIFFGGRIYFGDKYQEVDDEEYEDEEDYEEEDYFAPRKMWYYDIDSGETAEYVGKGLAVIGYTVTDLCGFLSFDEKILFYSKDDREEHDDGTYSYHLYYFDEAQSEFLPYITLKDQIFSAEVSNGRLYITCLYSDPESYMDYTKTYCVEDGKLCLL